MRMNYILSFSEHTRLLLT